MAVVRRQQGAGAGKSCRLVRSLVADYPDVRVILVLTKPHTNKVMLFTKLLNDVGVEYRTEVETRRARIVTFVGEHGARKEGDIVIFATVDSFMVAVGDVAYARGTQAFSAAVNSIVDRGPQQLARRIRRNGEGLILFFKGERLDVRKGVVIVDEAQDLPTSYLVALMVYAEYTETRVVLVGDALQSISLQENAMTGGLAPYEETPTNTTMRFGWTIARFVNGVVWDAGNDVRGLPSMRALRDGGRVFARKVPFMRRPDATKMDATVGTVMAALVEEYEQSGGKLVPWDVLVVSPRVRGDPIMDILEMRISEFWTERGFDDGAYLHVSEPGHPVNLDHSAKATRLVSIHAAKGDDRPVVFVIGLTERALVRFACDTAGEPTKSLIYLSLIHVALTRAKESLYVFVSDNEDDVTIRLRKVGLVDWVLVPDGKWQDSNLGIFCDRIHKDVSTDVRDMIDALVPRDEAEAPTGDVVDAVHHYVEYSCMVIGAIMQLIGSGRAKGTLVEFFGARGAMRSSPCMRFTFAEYARRFILPSARSAAVVPIVVAARGEEGIAQANALERLVRNVQGAHMPRCALEMSVVLYVLGHTVPNALDGTRGMYRPLTLYRVMRWFRENPCAVETGCGCMEALGTGTRYADSPCMISHAARLGGLNAQMERAMKLVPDAIWRLDHHRPPDLSPMDAFPLVAHRSVLFHVATDETEYVVHLHCRMYSDFYRNSVDALIDAMVQSRWTSGGRRAACMIIALDAGSPIVIEAPHATAVPLKFIRESIWEHYARFNARASGPLRNLDLKSGPRYARDVSIDEGTPDAGVRTILDAALDECIGAYVDAIPRKMTRVRATDAASFLMSWPESNYEFERMGGYAAYEGEVEGVDARDVGINGPELGAAWMADPCMVRDRDGDPATSHAAHCVVWAAGAFCGGIVKFEVTLLDVQRHGRTLSGRVDAAGGGVFLEFKLHAARCAGVHQMVCYLAMVGGGVGYVVGLLDAVVWRVCVPTRSDADAIIDAILE
jgi:hypothetical protein